MYGEEGGGGRGKERRHEWVFCFTALLAQKCISKPDLLFCFWVAGEEKKKKIIILEPENLGKRGHLLCRGKFLLVLIKLGATRGHQGGGGGGKAKMIC